MPSSDPGVAFHHLGLRVSDLDRAVAWYDQALGFELERTGRVPEGIRIAFVKNQHGERLELFEIPAQAPVWDGPIPALRGGHGHLGVIVSQVDASFARAVDAGATVVWEPRAAPSPGVRIAFVADPDGNLIELMSFPPGRG